MVVAESATAQGKAASGERTGTTDAASMGAAVDAGLAMLRTTAAALRPVCLGVFASLGLVLLSAGSPDAAAQVVADPNAPANQRPTVLNAGNGVPVVNIQTPSAAGVSRNTYKQFDVNGNGVILNNSRTDVQTQLGGFVQGNPWLATGSARVILNEVNSSNPSQLRGYIEVGGQKAEVIIANPAGVAIDGAGFINASRVTITTGNTQVNGGSLEGYLVQRGQVSINGKGLDTSTAGYTAILARAVQVNGGIWAKELNVTTGANQISASEGGAAAVTSAPGSVAGQGAAPLYALDVSALGGMYAGKILLIGTESGVGVSNAGTIGASAGQVQLSSEGLLTNSGTINSTSNLTLDATGGISNSGTVYAATNTSLASQSNISNSGLIAAAGDTTVQASGTLAQINNSASGVMAAGLAADGKLDTTGNLTINAQGTAQLAGRSMAGNSVNVTGAVLDLSTGQLSANSLTLTGRTGDINATGAALSSQTTLQASTTQTLRTDGATVAADQLKLTAKNLSNAGGQIIQTGVSDTTIALAGSMDNSQGRIATNSANLTLSANSLNNTDGKVEHAGSGTLAVNAASLSGARGTITTANTLTITSADLNNDNAHIEAKALTVNAGKLSNQKGDILQTGTGAASITATAALNNAQGAIISNGDLNVAANSLNNQGGAVQATGTSGLKMDVTNKLDNSAAGTLNAGGQAALTAGSLSNDSGRITAGTSLVAMVAGSASNQAGLMAATQTLSLNAASLDNTRGTLASVQSNASVTTTGSTVNNSGRIEAAQAVTLVNTGLSNTTATGTPTATNAGSISGNSLNINTQGQTLNNTSGTLAATSSAILNTGTLNNNKGAVQSGGTLEIDTHGQTLTNTAAAAYTDGGPGKAGGISAQGAVTLRTGTLNNAAGFIGANGALTATTGQLSNAAAGEIISTKTIVLTTTGLGNQSGKISGSDNVTLNAGTGSINNTGGLLASNAALSLSAASVVNTDTISLDALKPKGMEAASVAINATSIDNQRGSVRADQSTTLTSAGSINNSGGTLSAGGTVVLQDTSANKTLTITNTAGNVLADQQVTISATSLTGDGTVQSTNNLAINLTSNFANSGQVKAGNNATITTTADLTNSGKLQAGNVLAVNAANIHNTATGDIAGGTTRLTAVNTLTNRGVIDGSVTALRATTVNNLGTGSIYGDDISIAATTLNNDAENGKGAAIAARNSLHIGAANVLNREGSLMFSAGDMAIGGSIDANGRAQGYASNIINASATIDVLGDLDIKTANLLNTNLHFSTTTKTTSQASGIKLLYGGVEYSEDQVGTNFGPLSKIDEDAPEWRVLAPSAEFPASQFPMNVQSWAYPLTISLGINNVSQVPYKIALSGYPSNHIIWSKFGIAPPSPAPVYAGVLRCDINGNNCVASDPASYNLYRTAYNAWLVTANQANAKLAQKAQAYNDSIDGRLLRDWTTVEYTETTVTPEVATTKPAVMTVGGNLSGVFTQSATNDKSQIIVGGNNLLSGLQISNLPPVLDKVAIRDNFYTYSEFEADNCSGFNFGCDDNRKYTHSTTRTEVRTPVPLEIYKVKYNQVPAHTGTDPARSLLAGINAASAVGGKPVQVSTTPATPVAAAVPPVQTVPSDFPGRVIRTTTPNLTLPNNALFTITTSPTSAYLVETDPRFANYRQWLGSDYLLNALSIDPNTVQKRLGDGFYEQKLIREQIALLTGRRFTGDFSDDTTQYMALMNSGATYAKQHNLRPGVALSDQQMAQLTSDIVWLVEQTVTLPNGTTTRALVPQVYIASVRAGDIDGTGTLISGKNVQLDFTGDVNNAGTLYGRKVININANNVNNLGGRIQGQTVNVDAKQDINNIGGQIIASQRLQAVAGRDINVTTTTKTSTSTGTNGTNASSTSIDRIAGLYVTGEGESLGVNPDGSPIKPSLFIKAERDINLTAGIIQSQGSATLVAKQDINLKTVETSSTQNINFDNNNYIKLGQTQDVGSTISANGAVTLYAERDITAKAASIASQTDTTALIAKRDITLTTGVATSSYDEGHQSTQKGFLSKTTTTTRETRDSSTSIGSAVEGKDVLLQAGNNIRVTGSSVASDTGTSLVAGNNLIVEAAQNTTSSTSSRDEKKTGLMIGGSIGNPTLNLGMKEGSTRTQNTTTQSGSSITSANGNTSLIAQEGVLAVIASNVGAAADKQLSLQGAQVVLSGALNSNQSTSEQTKKSTNLHAGIVKPSEGALSRGTAKGNSTSTSLAATTLSGGNISIKATGTPGKDKDGNENLSGISLAGVKLNTKGELALDAGQGNLAFNIIETTQSTSLETTQRDIAYQKAQGAGSTEGSAQYNQLNYGKLSIKAGSVTVQTGTSATGKGKVDSSVGQSAPATPTQLKDLATKPGMAWVNDVAAQSAELAKTNPAAALHVQNVQLAHDQWDYKQQGLTKEGAAIVTLVVAYFTAGAASGAGSALATGVGATGTTAAAVVAGATTAALSSLAAQASVSFINNGGNLGAVLNELGSKDSVKGLLTAMVTAGALNGLSSAMGGVTATGGTPWSQINATSPFVDQLQKNLVNQLTSNVLQTALTGGNSQDYEKGLQTSLLTAFISTGAAQGANAIGDMQANGSLNALTHKLAHAIAGCAAGAATASVGGGSAGNGCGSGAIGAVIGELTAQAVGGSSRSNTDTINLARLLGGVAGALTGGDVNLAATAGGNAAENNYLNHTDAARLASLKDKQRVGKCDTRCDKEIKALQVKDSTSNRALAACEGVNSSACDSVRQEVRKAAADYIRQGFGDPLTELNPTYSREKSETLQLADATMTGQNQGTVEGLYNGVKDGVVGTASLLSDLFASAFGNTQAQLDLNAKGQGMYNFLKDPDNWPQLLGAMSAQEREQLALAYERGDGHKIGEIGAAALLNIPMAGPLGVIKKIDTVTDVARVGDLPKGVSGVVGTAGDSLAVVMVVHLHKYLMRVSRPAAQILMYLTMPQPTSIVA